MKRIFISAGEASGDLHAANLIHRVHSIAPHIQFSGMGGDKMQAAGCEIFIDLKKVSVVGSVEAVTHLKAIFSAMRLMRRKIREERPDLLILIDYPEFNLRLAKYAKKQGIKVLYYISPQIWAWRQGRVKIIRKYVDHMAVIYPFEADFYRQASVPVSYVGNPLLDIVIPTLSKPEVYQKFDLSPQTKIVGLVPGSRQGEIKRMFTTILDAATLLKKRYPETTFVLPLASTLSMQDLQPYLQNYDLDIKIIPNQLYNLMQICDAVIAVSGTVTVETALMETPMVIIYKLTGLSYFIGKLLIKVKFAGMCNLMANEHIVPELIQNEATPENIVSAIRKMLDDQTYNENMRQKLSFFKNQLRPMPGQKNLAELVVGMF